MLVGFGFNSGLFRNDFWGGGTEVYSAGAIWGQVRSTMLVTVFVFIGIEGASVYSTSSRSTMRWPKPSRSPLPALGCSNRS